MKYNVLHRERNESSLTFKENLIMLFTELNTEQQEAAIETNRYYNVENCDWFDSTKEDFHYNLRSLGFDYATSYFSGFCSQGDGASFKTKYINIETVLRNLKRWTKYRALHEMIRGNDIEVYIEQNGNYVHDNTMSIYASDLYINTTGIQDGLIESLLEDILEYAKRLARDYYGVLESEYYDLISDDSVKQALIDNEMQFEEDPREEDVCYI